jgi:hypothetical protein
MVKTKERRSAGMRLAVRAQPLQGADDERSDRPDPASTPPGRTGASTNAAAGGAIADAEARNSSAAARTRDHSRSDAESDLAAATATDVGMSASFMRPDCTALTLLTHVRG